MKKIFVILVFVILFVSCGGGEGFPAYLILDGEAGSIVKVTLLASSADDGYKIVQEVREITVPAVVSCGFSYNYNETDVIEISQMTIELISGSNIQTLLATLANASSDMVDYVTLDKSAKLVVSEFENSLPLDNSDHVYGILEKSGDKLSLFYVN